MSTFHQLKAINHKIHVTLSDIKELGDNAEKAQKIKKAYAPYRQRTLFLSGRLNAFHEIRLELQTLALHERLASTRSSRKQFTNAAIIMGIVCLGCITAILAMIN